mmetsp:Transcript_7052/g.16271  ORF Transcript_7052/g.16271 Transcript_7052/m.16271 type:complete len:504 (-) Transcript_7052:61-1572(-)
MAKTAATPKVETPAGRDGEKAKNKPKPTRKRRPKRQRENKQTDDREHEPNANDDAGTPPPSRRRGRPAAPEDVSKDVIYAKGAAAQTMTNPGNLLYYRLCDERFEEWSALKSHDPRKKSICVDIIDAIEATGGVFRSKTGGVLDRLTAENKTKDRMRQIAKPKLRPTGFGEDDVVFATGSASFLYPGNKKFRSICDGYVLAYWKDFINGTEQPRPAPAFKPGMCSRPQYQVQIVDDIITAVTDQGGVFRDSRLNELSRKVVASKIFIRFKDLKKDLVKGKRTFVDATAGGSVAGDGKKPASSDPTGRTILEQRIGGFTKVTNVVTSVKEMRILQRANKRKRREERKSKNGGKTPTKGKRKRGLKDEEDEEDEDEVELNLESDDEGSGSGPEGDDDALVPRLSPTRQAIARSRRMKRREAGLPVPALKRSTRRKSKVAKTETSAGEKKSKKEESHTPERPLSDYEKLRLEKIKRNEARLASLGLLGPGVETSDGVGKVVESTEV